MRRYRSSYRPDEQIRIRKANETCKPFELDGWNKGIPCQPLKVVDMAIYWQYYHNRAKSTSVRRLKGVDF